ncbi:MAG: BamA/TamA family outer membrane protein [Armatimonadetes bacterium]|nr:BamA/TamA family outer membrane protein [Armatimonadota bacterium]
MPYRMFGSKTILVIFAAVAAVGVLGAVAFAQESTKVVQVVVSGNQNINTDTIQNVISLKPGDDYTEQATERDRAAIMSLGLFIAVTVHKEDASGGIKITYEVTENPLVTDIKIVGSDPIPASEILELIKTKPGQVLNTTTLNQDIEAIQAYYSDEGYIGYVTADVGPDPQTGVLTIPILVNTVESIEITGNKKTKSWVFLREMKTKPGSVFNAKVLKEDIIRIYNLDILEDIKPYQLLTGSEIGRIRIIIPVVEKKTGQVSVGIGYSTRQRLVGQARLSETNFRGRAQGLNILWEQGTIDAVGGSASYEVGFYEPWIDKRHTSLSVSAYNKLIFRFSQGVFGSATFANDQVYNERHKGGDITLSRPISDVIRVYVGARSEYVDTNPSLLTFSGDLAKIAQKGSVTVGTLRAVRNTRDFDLDPSAGGYEGIAVEFGTTNAARFKTDQTQPSGFAEVPFDGEFNKFSIDLRRYFSKGGRKTDPNERKTTLAVRLRAGVASGQLPFFEQFFVGGSESLRGYREDRFWGNSMFLASVELRHPIAQAITLVAPFVDYGDAWGGNPEFFIGELSQDVDFVGHYGIGIGLRVTTPIGHLRLDYGVGSEGGRTHFSMGHAF